MWRGTSDHDLDRLVKSASATVAPEAADFHHFGLWMEGELKKLEARWVRPGKPQREIPQGVRGKRF